MAARLDELSRPPDLVAQDGLESLAAQARGSEDRLRMLLTSALFIASTEDSDTVGEDHVLRAAAALDSGPGGQQAGPEPGDLTSGPRPADPRLSATRWPFLTAVAATAFVAVAAAIYLAAPGFLPRGQHQQAPPATIFTEAAIAPSAPHQQTLGLAATTPALTVPPTLPEPSADEAGEALPTAPPAEVLVRYTIGNPGAAAVVQSLTRRLQAIGVSPSFGLATRGQLTAPSISYFYEEDRDTAIRVAAAAGPGMLPPRLMNPLTGTTLRPPGTIEIAVP